MDQSLELTSPTFNHTPGKVFNLFHLVSPDELVYYRSFNFRQPKFHFYTYE